MSGGTMVVTSDAPALRRPTHPDWDIRYRRHVIAWDVIAAGVVSTGGVLWGVGEGPALLGGHVAWDPTVAGAMGAGSVVLAVAVLAVFRAWERSVLGAGSEEFNRVARAYGLCCVLAALIGLATKVDAVRPWVFGLFPLMGLVTLAGRYGLRRRLHRARGRGRCMLPVLAVGSAGAVSDLVLRSRRVPSHGWDVVAACVPPTGDARVPLDVPFSVGLDDVATQAHRLQVRVVAVTPAPGWTPQHLHRLAWDLEGSGVELVVDAGLMEVGGPRLHVAPVDGLPLLRLSEPRFSGVARVIKYGSDRLCAAVLLVALAPLLVVIGALVASDGGPMLYRQTRSGQRGRSFTMIKFRSMEVGADAERPEGNDADGPLFKLRADPRVTRVGTVIRRYSLDELPQLVNVLLGSMSLVGPRPPLPSEVEAWGHDARRKLLVRPGLTGLWQVSGRSDLSWEDSVRLDLRYVENWTPMMDVAILWKTVWAVLRGNGAY